jgi:hypothetical protein
MTETDILRIDSEIRAILQKDLTKIDEYKIRLEKLKKCMKVKNLSPKIYNDLNQNYEDIKDKIRSTNSEENLQFYIIESIELLEEYKKILTIPIKMSFVGKPMTNNRVKRKIVKSYMNVARKYTSIVIQSPPGTPTISCDNCQNKKNFDVVNENVYICLDCSAQRTVIKHTSSYKDIDRINISAKYTYDRRVHFRDTINQYQGKQNSTIDDKVYKDLKEQFRLHHILKGDKNSPKEIRFAKITKEHIMIFLKDMSYTKHYENVNLIHYTITGKKPDDIGYIEDKLMFDFDLLTDIYDKKFKDIERKNFINTQYVLYQLLLRHKHPCKKQDFTMLKTIDRKSFHDDITSVLFTHLNWSHYSLF